MSMTSYRQMKLNFRCWEAKPNEWCVSLVSTYISEQKFSEIKSKHLKTQKTMKTQKKCEKERNLRKNNTEK